MRRFFLTSLPSNSKSGSFHVLRLNNCCMINQTRMHMSAFFFFFFLCHCTSNMLILLSHLLFRVHPISALVLNWTSQLLEWKNIHLPHSLCRSARTCSSRDRCIQNIPRVCSEKLDIQDSISQSICGVLRQFPVPVKFPLLTYKI